MNDNEYENNTKNMKMIDDSEWIRTKYQNYKNEWLWMKQQKYENEW